MLNFTWGKKSKAGDLEGFLKREKERRKEAEEFLQFAAAVLEHVSENVLGTEGDTVIEEHLVFRQDGFYVLEKGKKEAPELLTLKGRLFWEGVQAVTNYLESLLEDIQRREEGRDFLMNEMRGLSKRIAAHPVLGFGKKARRHWL